MIKILLVEDDLSLSNSVFDFLDDFADVMQVFDGDEGLYEISWMILQTSCRFSMGMKDYMKQSLVFMT